MNNQPNIPSIDAEIPGNAVSVYGQNEPLEDFPVLKAFQQYVDAEQAKARKRLLTISAFFGVLMIVVICAFVAMLISLSDRNQQLNDKLVEFVMRERGNSSPVVVQPSQDASALIALTAKMDALQKKLTDDQAKAEKAAEEARQAAIDAALPKKPTADQMEIQRLKTLLAAEKEKANLERERQRQEEIEAYRRKYYPELYEPRPVAARRRPVIRNYDDDEYDLVDEDAISYFDEDADADEDTSDEETEDIKIPVEVKTSTGSRWTIPED